MHLDVKNERQIAKDPILIKYGRLDILVNNAGITGFLETNSPFDAENAGLDSWDEIHRVNSNK